jgi:GNAT superfamily N-acetyltransferase
MSTQQQQEARLHIRWMIRRDMAEVLEIENESFEFPWSEEEFIRCLRQRNCIGMVADCDDKVVGFMVYELHKTRLHILNFAVGRTWRRQGIGRKMASKLVGKLSAQRRTRIVLEVRETNLDRRARVRKRLAQMSRGPPKPPSIKCRECGDQVGSQRVSETQAGAAAARTDLLRGPSALLAANRPRARAPASFRRSKPRFFP